LLGNINDFLRLSDTPFQKNVKRYVFLNLKKNVKDVFWNTDATTAIVKLSTSVRCSFAVVMWISYCQRDAHTRKLRLLPPFVTETRSAVAKRPCDCCVRQLWWKYNWKRIFCTEPYRSIFNHCDVIGLLIYRIRWNNAKRPCDRALRHSRSFKVTDVGTNGKPIWDFLLGP